MLATERPRRDRPRSWRLLAMGLGSILLALLIAQIPQNPAAHAQQEDGEDTAQPEEGGETGETGETETDTGPSAEEIAAQEALDDRLREGSQAYSQICAACHQPGGIGITGQYPPLRDNPNVADTDYVRSVITTGRAGQIEVAGVLYDGVMPSFSTLPDDDIDAIIAFVQNDFEAPPAAIIPQAGPVAGTELPALTNMGAWLAYIIAAGVALLVLGPRITSANDRLSFPWLDAWLRTAVIVAAVILFTIVIPDWAIRNGAVTSLSRFAQDLIGVSLWLAGLTAVLWGLWYAHRESRL